MTTITAQTTQVYQVFIRASPEQIWEAITTPEFTQQYFFGSHVDVTPERYTGLDGEGNDLVVGRAGAASTSRRAASSTSGARSTTRKRRRRQPAASSWEIERKDGFSLVTVAHDRLEDSPKTAENVAGGWMFVLSGLKTLLETGKPLAG